MTRNEVKALLEARFAQVKGEVRENGPHFEVRMTFRVLVPVDETMELEAIEARITNAKYTACFSVEHDLGVTTDLEKLVEMANRSKS